MIAEQFPEKPHQGPHGLPKRTRKPSVAGRTNGNRSKDNEADGTLKEFIKELRELKEYVSYYFAAKSDIAKATLRNTGLWITIGLLAFIAVGSLLVMAVWHALSGLAGGLGGLAGGRPWAGSLMAGFLVLTMMGLGVYFGAAGIRKSWCERTIRKYEKRRTRQRANFGRDVAHRASAAASNDG